MNPPSPEDVIAKHLRHALGSVPPAAPEFRAAVRLRTNKLLEALDAAGLRISPKLEDGPKLLYDDREVTEIHMLPETHPGGRRVEKRVLLKVRAIDGGIEQHRIAESHQSPW